MSLRLLYLFFQQVLGLVLLMSRPSGPGAETAAIREWAGANGFTVSARGRIAA